MGAVYSLATGEKVERDLRLVERAPRWTADDLLSWAAAAEAASANDDLSMDDCVRATPVIIGAALGLLLAEIDYGRWEHRPSGSALRTLACLAATIENKKRRADAERRG